VVKEKEIIVEEGDNKEIHEEEVEEKKKEKIEIKEIVMEKNVRKSWHTTTLVPSSKLVSVVKCWDSSNIIQLPNFSSLCHEGNIVSVEEFSQQVERNFDFWKYDYFHESQGKENHTYFLNPDDKFSNVEVVTFHEFFRFIFDP
jgi:hypothetical protein